MPTWEQTKDQLHREDPELAEAYDEMAPAYLLAREVIRCRGELHLSQAELARRVGTSQSVISRIENMETSPNLKTVMMLAEGMNRRVELRLVDKTAIAVSAAQMPEWLYGTPEQIEEGFRMFASHEIGKWTDLVRKMADIAYGPGESPPDDEPIQVEAPSDAEAAVQ
jgi:transcriptional regulator with XRE-family HTH domain